MLINAYYIKQEKNIVGGGTVFPSSTMASKNCICKGKQLISGTNIREKMKKH